MIGKTNAQRKILLTTPDAVTPTKSQQIITTPDSYDGMDQVTVNAISDEYIDTSDTTIIKSSSDLTTSGATVIAPAGYYPEVASKAVATVTQATPSISISSTGKITASATQTAGYVAAGTKSGTKQMTTKAATTWTPTTSNQTIASGTYLTGTQTIKGDSNLIASNIKNNVSIFGVTGTMKAGYSYGRIIDIGSTSTSTLTIENVPYEIDCLTITSRTSTYYINSIISFIWDNTNIGVVVTGQLSHYPSDSSMVGQGATAVIMDAFTYSDASYGNVHYNSNTKTLIVKANNGVFQANGSYYATWYSIVW